jgi:hypothetical protein
MQLPHLLVGRRTVKALSALLTAALLAPAPVLAFTWAGNWQTITSFSTTGPLPSFSPTDGTTASGGSNGILQVQIPTVAVNGTKVASVIELSRQLTITNGSDAEFITVSSMANSFILNASVKVKVWYTPMLEGTNATAITFHKSAGNHSKSITGLQTVGTRLTRGSAHNAGNYVVHVRITFETKGRAHHTNSYGTLPNTASTHTFTFTGN